MDERALLHGLTEAQREAVASDAAPLCVLAGPGSGKTQVLTRRIAYQAAVGRADPTHVLTLTFTRAAAGELRARLAALGVRSAVAAGTFHAVAYGCLRRCWADRGVRPPTLLPDRRRLLSRLVDGHPVAVASAEVAWAKARLVPPAGYADAAEAAGRRPPIPLSVVAALFERYEEEKRRRRLVDFDDLLVGCARALEHDPELAAAWRWRFRHLFVDEYQDVNPAQARLLEAWRGGRPDLTVVGDPDQAIYSWNGADPQFLRDFARRHPGTKVVRLEHNFRSSPQVVAVGAAALGRRPGSTTTTATRPPGPAPTVTAYRSDLDEARGVARALRDHRPPGGSWSRLAVLARTHALLALVAQACAAAGVPVRHRRARERPGPGELDAALASLRDSGGGAQLAPLVPDLDAGPVRTLAEELCALDPRTTVESFLAWVTATTGADPVGDAAGVELATFHAAKGLEWPTVFVVGLEAGAVPSSTAATPEAVAEERRLLHVAVTRAEQELHCSWARRRLIGGVEVARRPSPWLDDLLAAADDAAGATPPGGGHHDRPPLADARRRLPPAHRPDDDLLAALRRWRAAAARAAGVRPAAVVPDDTLAAVASSRPADADALGAVPGLGPTRAARFGEALLAVVSGRGAP